MRPTTAAASALLVALAASASSQDTGPKTWAFPTEERITDVAVSPDGRRLYLADAGGGIWIHDAADGKKVGKLTEHKERLAQIAFVGADPSLLVTSSRMEYVRTWDAALGLVRRRFTLPGNPQPEQRDEDGMYVPTWDHVFSVAAARDTPVVALANPDHRVEFWDLAADRAAGGFTFAGFAFAAAFAPDGGRIALSVGADEGVDHAIEVFRTAGGTPLWKDGVRDVDSDPKARENGWLGLEFSPDGKWLLAWGWRSDDGKEWGGLRLYDAATGARKWTDLYDFGVWKAAFSPGGDRIAFSSKHGVSLFDPATGEEVIGLESKSGVMNDVAFSPDGRFLYGAPWRADGVVRWDLAGEVRVVEPVKPRSGAVVSKAPADAGRSPAAPAAPTAGAKKALIDHGARVSSIALSPDGARVATGGKDGAVRVFDVASGARTAEWKGLGEVRWVGWIGADGDRLAAGGVDGIVRCWNLATKEQRWRFDASPRNAAASATAVPTEFVVAGSQILAAAADGTVRAFDAATGELRASIVLDEKFGKPAFIPSCLAVSPDGRRVVAGGTDILGTTKARVLDLDAARTAFSIVARLPGRADDAPVESWTAMAITPDAATALGLSGALVHPGGMSEGRLAGILRSWDLAAATLRWRLDLPEAPDAGALSPKGDVFAVALRDGVHLVSVTTGKDTRTLALPGEAVKCLAFAPNGLRLFAGTAAGPVRTWDLGAGK